MLLRAGSGYFLQVTTLHDDDEDEGICLLSVSASQTETPGQLDVDSATRHIKKTICIVEHKVN